MTDMLTAAGTAIFEAPCASCGSDLIALEIDPDGVAEIECVDCGASELVGGNG